MTSFTLTEIAARVGGTIEGGTPSLRIFGVKSLEEAGEGDLTFATRRSDATLLQSSAASAVMASHRFGPLPKPAIRVLEPRFALARVLELFHAPPRRVAGVDPRAVIAPDVQLGRDVSIAAGAWIGSGAKIGDRADIYPGAYLGERVQIGEDTVIFSNVSIYPDTQIGRRVRIHSGAVIGADGFGYAPAPGGDLYKIPQVGTVSIADDVEIGANTTIDRGTLSSTRIGKGAKIDNLVQIAHNVCIGEHVCIAGQSGVAGSARIEDHVILAAGVGLKDHVTVAAKARVAARSAVMRDVAAGATVGGSPALPEREARSVYALLPHLPALRRRLRALERKCAALEAELATTRKV